MPIIKWIKITTDMFDDEKIKLIDSMPERDTIIYIWMRLLVQAGRTNSNGLIFLNPNIPYSDEMLSSIFNRPLNSVRLALDVLSKFQMIQVLQDKSIKIINWDKHQNIDGMERIRNLTNERVKKHREKKRLALTEGCTDKENEDCNVTETLHVTNVTQTEEERELDKDIDIERESIKEKDETFSHSLEIIKLCESATGHISKLNIGAVRISIKQHGYENVRKATLKAIECDKCSMNYINGILRAWAKEGYPKDEEIKLEKQRASSNGSAAYKPFDFDFS